MVLLLRIPPIIIYEYFIYLHSNMVLLLHLFVSSYPYLFTSFTFQYGVTITGSVVYYFIGVYLFTFQYGVTITNYIK